MKLKKTNKEASIVLNKEAKSTVSDLPPVLRTSTTDYNKPSKPGAPSKAATPAPSKKPTKSATVEPREASKPRVVKKSPPRRTKPRSGYSTAVGKVKKAHKAIGSPGSLPVKGSGGGVVFNIPFQEGAVKLKKIIEEELEDLINEGSGDIAFVDRHGKPRKPAKVTVPEPEAKGDTDLTQKMIKQRDKDNPVKKIQQLAKVTPKQIKKAKPKRKRHEKLGRRKAGDPLPKKRRLRRSAKTGKPDPKGTILPTDKRGLEEAYKHTSTKDILNIQENIMKNKQYTSFEKEQKIFVHWREYLNEETVRGDREKAQRADQLKNAPHQMAPKEKAKAEQEKKNRDKRLRSIGPKGGKGDYTDAGSPFIGPAAGRAIVKIGKPVAKAIARAVGKKSIGSAAAKTATKAAKKTTARARVNPKLKKKIKQGKTTELTQAQRDKLNQAGVHKVVKVKKPPRTAKQRDQLIKVARKHNTPAKPPRNPRGAADKVVTKHKKAAEKSAQSKKIEKRRQARATARRENPAGETIRAHQKVPGVKPKKVKESLSRSLVESSMPGYFLEEISDAVEDYIYEFIKYPRRPETDDALDKVHQQLNKPTKPKTKEEKPKCKNAKKCKYVVKIKKTKEKLKERSFGALGAASTVADVASTAKNISKGKFSQAAKSAVGLVPAVGAVKAGADVVGAGIKAGQQAAKRVVPNIVSQRAPTNIKQSRRLAKEKEKTDAALTAPTKASTGKFGATAGTGKIPQSSLARGIYNVFLKEYLKAAIEAELETEL